MLDSIVLTSPPVIVLEPYKISTMLDACTVSLSPVPVLEPYKISTMLDGLAGHKRQRLVLESHKISIMLDYWLCSDRALEHIRDSARRFSGLGELGVVLNDNPWHIFILQ